MQNVNLSVWVYALPIMLTEHTLTYLQTMIHRKFDLDTLSFQQLIKMFQKRYNTTERILRLMDEWNALEFTVIAKYLPDARLEDHRDYFLEMLGKLQPYLKNMISEFQYKCKILATVRSIPAFHIARMSVFLMLEDLQSLLQRAASRYDR